MKLTIDFAAGTPIYRQVLGQIRCQVALGLLEPGSVLPSIRALALELKVAPNTIARAYQELVTAGVVHKRRGFGTFVSCEPARIVDDQRRHLIEQRIDALLAEACEQNFTPGALVEMMHHRQVFMARSREVTATRDAALPGDTLAKPRP